MHYKITTPNGDKIIKENIYDRWVAWKDPVKAQERLFSRAQMALVGNGGWTAATRGRGKDNHGFNDADSEASGQRKWLNSDSRHLYRNNPIATGIIDTNCINIVGTGLKPQCRVKKEFLSMTDKQAAAFENDVDMKFRLLADSVECDTTRISNFWRLQYLAMNSTLQNGDVLALFPKFQRVGCPYKSKIQIIESDRVTNPMNAQDTTTLVEGVEKDKNGAPKIYHVQKTHPGSNINLKDKNKWDNMQVFNRQGLRNAVLPFFQTRPGQTRGISYLANVIDTILLAGDYITAEQKAAVTGGLLTVFINKENPGTTLGPAGPVAEFEGTTADEDYKMGYGNVVTMGLKEKINTPTPGRPNQSFGPFMESIFEIIGQGVNIPMEVLRKRFNSNYTAAKAAIMDAWKFFLFRREWLIDSFCKPFYELWFWEAVTMDGPMGINAPGFLDDPLIRKAYLNCIWIGPLMESVDPLKDAKTDELYLKMNATDLATIAAKKGRDIEEIIPQRGKEIRLLKDNGLPQKEIEAALKTVNETRALEKLKPIPGGNAIFMPSSLIPALEEEEEEEEEE